MKAFPMVGEHNRVLDMDRTTIRFILSLGSNNSSKIGTTEEYQGQKRIQTFEDQVLNVHEKKFSEFKNFQANTTVFQTNINATLRNLETQVGQLALSFQSQSRNTFAISTEINPKDLTPTAMRGSDEVHRSKKM